MLGAKDYADAAALEGDNILGVLNLDMMAYDNDDDNDFDIDVQNIANSVAMKDQILSVLATYGFNLNVNVVNPGTPLSDHKRFWDQGYSAVLMGESWFNNDQSQYYRTDGDTFATLDIPYYNEMTKLVLAYMATVGGLVNIDNTVSVTTTILTANQAGATYQWLDCNNSNAPIPLEINQSFVPASNGIYAVQVTIAGNVEISNCVNFNLLSSPEINKRNIELYPNPVQSILNVDLPQIGDTTLKIINLEGKVLLHQSIKKTHK